MPTKVFLVKAMIFPVVMYGCESCTIRKADCQRIDVLNCDVGEDSGESLGLQRDQTSQSEEISPKYLLERLILTLTLKPPDAKSRLIRKYPDTGKN